MGKTEKLGLTKILTFSNIKLGGKIPQLNMPYGITCRSDAPCFKDCYCTHGNMTYKCVREGHKRRLELYKSNPEAFFEMVDKEMSSATYEYFRFHSAGDIVDAKYLDLMCWLARRHKETRFLCFTKKFELVNTYFNEHNKPKNLTIVLSNWGSWHVKNPHNFPESYVDFGRGDENIPESAYECGGNCGNCDGKHCWHMKKGDSVFFHKH